MEERLSQENMSLKWRNEGNQLYGARDFEGGM